jgi:hypothetical protein
MRKERVTARSSLLAAGSALLLTLGLVVALASRASADTIFVLQIDPGASTLTYLCPSPCSSESFSISGEFELHLLDPDLVTLGYGNARLYNQTVAAGSQSIPFQFPSYPTELDGTQLRGDANECSWPGPPGSSGVCVSTGFFPTFSGTFDGDHLHITGFDPVEVGPIAPRGTGYSYDIHAALVPEPTSLILAACGLFAGAMRRRS